MLKNLDAPLTDLDGKPIREGEDDLTVKRVAVNALLGQAPNESPTGEEKATRYTLALRLHAGGEHDLKADELALIKRLVGVMYLPLVVGQVWAWCDGDPE